MKNNTHSYYLLQNNRVRLEPLSWNHLDALLPIALKHPTLLKYSPVHFGNKEALKSYFENIFTQIKEGTRQSYAIYDKHLGAYAGHTAYMNMSPKDQRLEIGSTWLGKEFQRTGLNRNCKFLLLQNAFEILDYQRVELKTDERNEQSKTAIKAIGAKYEGLLRSHTLMTDGHRRDTVYFSILREEWARTKKAVFIGF